MSSIERVREIGADERMPEARIEAARRTLLREMAQEARKAPRARTRRVGLGLGIGLGGAGALLASSAAVTAIVAANVVAPPVAPHAAASEILETASAAVTSAQESMVADGQYLRIETARDYLVTDAEINSDAGPGAPAVEGAFTYQEVDVLYVPADRSQNWIEDTTTPTEVTGVYGPGGDELRDSVMGGYDYRESAVRAYPEGIRSYPGLEQPVDVLRDSYDEMPREPEELLKWFQTTSPGGEVKAMLDALYMNLPPADIRSALLGALALSEAFEVVDQTEETATLELDRVEGGSEQFQIDTTNGIITEVVTVRDDDAIVPAGTPDIRQTFTTSVVDTAPAPSE
jgi:hypothetical protein